MVFRTTQRVPLVDLALDIRFAGRLVVLALGIGATVVSAPVIAEGSDIGIEEIIVTARKREESVQDVPISMTALSQEIRDSSVRDISDLNAYLPNVIIEDSAGRSRGSAINIRGLSYTETDKSFDPPVAVVLDGIVIGTSSGQLIENFDLERLEVLRGPQGTLFGRNTVGGVVNAIRTRPTGELGGKVRVTAGKWDQREVRAVMNLPSAGEMLSTKLFYTMIKNDGHMNNVFLNEDGPAKDYQNYGAALLFEPGNRFEALLTVEQYKDDSDLGAPRNRNTPGFFACDVLGDCEDPSFGKSDYESDETNTANFDTDAISLTMSLDINDNLSLVSVTGWRDETEDYISSFDGTPSPYISIDNDNTHEQKSQEIRLEGTYEKFNFVLGSFFWDNHYDQNWTTLGSFWQNTVPGLDINVPIPGAGGLGLTDLCLLEAVGALRCQQSVGLGSSGLGDNFIQLLFQEQDVNAQAVFFQGDYIVNEKLSLTAGIRWTREEKEFRGAQSYLAPLSSYGQPAEQWAINAAGELDIFDDSSTWKDWSPKFGVNYKIAEDILVYATYSEGFHSGGYFGRNQNAADFANTYEPEYAQSYEIGFKSQFFENRVQLNAAIFFNDFDGKQESTVKLDTTTNTVVTAIDNVGTVEYLGGEAELRWVVTENFNIFASLGLLDAEYTDFCIDLDGAQADINPTSDCGIVQAAGANLAGDPLFLAPQDRTNLTPRFAPEVTFGIGGTYTLNVGPGALDLHARFNHIGKQETALDNAPGSAVSSADFLNASVTYSWDRYRVTAYGRNLTNERRETLTTVAPLFQSGSIEPGSSWGIELAANFGN